MKALASELASRRNRTWFRFRIYRPQGEVVRSRGAVFRARVLLNIVITSVSEAIQSLAYNLDCFVATAPRNDADHDHPDHEKIKGSGTPADAMSHARTQAACGTRHGVRRLAPPSACGRARLPAFHLRFSPTGLSSRRFSVGPGFPKTMRKLRRAARIVFGHSDAPRAPVVLPAGMMPEPPGCGVYRSARGRRTRSALREYPPRKRPFKSEIGCGYCHRGGEVKGR